MTTTLNDLPQFEILSVQSVGDDHELAGRFNHTTGLKVGGNWLYIPKASIQGSLGEASQPAMPAIFTAFNWTADCPAQAGTSWPVINGYYDILLIEAILDPHWIWRRVGFEAKDAQHFTQQGRQGWIAVGQPIPEGATPLHVERSGWDHEHCELCFGRIGDGGDPYGYVDEEDGWLCENCYERHARPHDLSFLVPRSSAG